MSTTDSSNSIKLNVADGINLIMTGFSCNNNCVNCSTGVLRKNSFDKITDEIEIMLRQGRRDGYQRIEFTGGEPTIRPDLSRLIKLASEIGFNEIGISTNGRFFFYEKFLSLLIKGGLNRITVTLYDSDSKIHDAIARTPGAFSQTLKGIKNIISAKKIKIDITTVVMRQNYKNLPKLFRFLNKFGIGIWRLVDLIPYGNAKNFYKSLAVSPLELSRLLNKIVELDYQKPHLHFIDFAPCLLTQKTRKAKNVKVVTAPEKMTIRQIGYRPTRFMKDQKNFYHDIHKTRCDFCRYCKFYLQCAGIWKDYLAIFDRDIIRTLAAKNNCLVTQKTHATFY